jgi:ribosomal protein S18 acetylase RimI-like enzyme
LPITNLTEKFHNEPSILFRTGSIADLKQLLKVGELSFQQYKDVLTEVNWQKLASGLQNENRLRELISIARTFICESEDRIIGAAYLVPSGHPEGVFESDWAVIRRVGVDPQFRGHGIAKKLTQLCIDQAKADGEKILALHTSEFMDAARHIYESLGFERYKEIDPLFGKKYWLYRLNIVKDIDKAL